MSALIHDDLREFLGFLQARGELVRVDREVASRYQLAAVQMKILNELDKAVLFTNVDGKGQQLAGNLYSSRRLISYMFGVPPEELTARVMACSEARTFPVEYVPGAPCQEVVLKGVKDFKEIIPITRNSEHDSGFFLTAAVVVCQDPESGKVNSAICRLEYKQDHFTVQLVANQHSWLIFQKYKKLGRDMPVAIVLGADPVFMFASESGIPYDQNEFEYAGAILGRPFKVARCRTVDLYVPAKAEIILEGQVSVSKEEMEGPMGEVTQYYGGKSAKPVVEIGCVTCRQNPISENIISGTVEEHSLLAVPMEGRLLARLRQVSPLVTAVNLLPFFFNCVVQLDDYPGVQEGIAKNVLLAALADPWVKTAVVVNRDVDLYRPEDVNWALATRVDFTRDVLRVDGAYGFPLDPMKESAASTVSKLGLDATVSPAQRDRFTRRWVVGYGEVKLGDWIS